MNVTVAFDWIDLGAITCPPPGRLTFPSVQATPGIYRFTVHRAGEALIYIGETSSLKRRLNNNYRAAHTGSTNVRVRAWLQEYIAAGHDVQLAIIETATLSIAGTTAAADLSMKRVRLLVEHAALAAAAASGHHITNL